MFAHKFATLAVLISCVLGVAPRPGLQKCDVPALTAAGWVCGMVRRTEHDTLYASFRGVPYAKQPIGELRFKELQPLEPWPIYYDAMSEGPVCPQHDVVYGRLMRPRSMSEACIHANIHVPLEFLPDFRKFSSSVPGGLMPPHQTAFQDAEDTSGLPIVVFVHGGGFAYGSGDADLYGPEYLISQRVIVITFNYRLNVMGFLSLNSSSIPGNNGLRDMVTLLRWVQSNARAFGGNPDDVTLAGQSSGAVCAHILSLSPVADGLFKRVWLMSGVGATGFYSPSPAYAQFIANSFLTQLGINTADPEEVHRQLIHTPIKKIIETNKVLLDIMGLTTFVPVVESALPGVTPVIDEDPEVLVAKGRGKDIPLVIGFTSTECETFRPRFEEINIISQINNNPMLVVAPRSIFTTLPKELPKLITRIHKQYFNGTVNMDKFINLCSDQYFSYPAMRLAALRSETGGAPVYLYRFSYDNKHNVLREALGLHYEGAAHIEDMTYVMNVNSILHKDSMYAADGSRTIKDRMITFFTSFMETSNPVAGDDTVCRWPPVNVRPELMYQNIEKPETCSYRELTQQQRKTKSFFDSINEGEKTE